MNNVTEQLITPDIIKSAMDYNEYRELIDELLAQNKTTGTNHSDAMLEYTRMNVHRMNRLDKRTKLTDSLKKALAQVDQQWIWLVLTEAWCGDAAQNIPPIVKMADQTDMIDIKFILRDQHPDIMDEYLTNGGRSIPKLVCLDADTLEEKGSWGPRPSVPQEMVLNWKNDPEISSKTAAKKLHKWYAKNRTRDLQEEFETLIKKWS